MSIFARPPALKTFHVNNEQVYTSCENYSETTQESTFKEKQDLGITIRMYNIKPA